MGCSQSKANEVEPPKNSARVAADRTGKSAMVNRHESSNAPVRKEGDLQANNKVSFPDNPQGSTDELTTVKQPSSSTSISDALDLASLKKEMKSCGDIAKTVVRIEVREPGKEQHTQRAVFFLRAGYK